MDYKLKYKGSEIDSLLDKIHDVNFTAPQINEKLSGFEIQQDGRMTINKGPQNDMDVATKKYVDENSGGGLSVPKFIVTFETDEKDELNRINFNLTDLLNIYNNHYPLMILQTDIVEEEVTYHLEVLVQLTTYIEFEGARNMQYVEVTKDEIEDEEHREKPILGITHFSITWDHDYDCPQVYDVGEMHFDPEGGSPTPVETEPFNLYIYPTNCDLTNNVFECDADTVTEVIDAQRYPSVIYLPNQGIAAVLDNKVEDGYAKVTYTHYSIANNEIKAYKFHFISDGTHDPSRYTNMETVSFAGGSSITITTTSGSESISDGTNTLNVMTRDTAQIIGAPKSFFNNIANNTLPLRIQGFANKTWGLEMDKDWGRLHFKFADVNGTNISNVTNHYTMDNAAFFPATNGGKDLGTSSYMWNNAYIAGNLTDGTNSISIAQIVAGSGAGLEMYVAEITMAQDYTKFYFNATDLAYLKANIPFALKCVWDDGEGHIGSFVMTLAQTQGDQTGEMPRLYNTCYVDSGAMIIATLKIDGGDTTTSGCAVEFGTIAVSPIV